MNGSTDHLLPGSRQLLSPHDFASTAGLSEEELHELEDFKLVQPDSLDIGTALALREANRLRADFDLDLFTIGLLAGYIHRIHDLQGELQHLRAHTPARTVFTEVSYAEVRVRR